MAVRIQLRRGTSGEWTAANPTLAAGELGIETDTETFKIGDGATAWNSLGYQSLPASAVANTIVDAKGDILAASANNVIQQLTVGTNGQFLRANSDATLGVSWETVELDPLPLILSLGG